MSDWSAAGLWLAVIGSGLYHGLNPGMGWPLAVSAALMGGGRRDLVAALGSLASGHFLAMAMAILPFAVLIALVEWQREIRIGAGAIVASVGVYLLLRRRHPKFLARIKPGRLAIWSFAAATAHGAGLMLAPVYLGLCRTQQMDGIARAAGAVGGNAMLAIQVAAVHAGVMVLAGAVLAFAVFESLGPKFIAKSWFNLETAWSLSLIGVGAIGIASALAPR